MVRRLLIGVLLVLTGILTASCAQKLPYDGAQSGGLLAIPMVATTAGPAGGFNYYYSYSGRIPEPFEIKIVPAIGQDFVLSQLLKPGKYIIDTYTVYGVPSINMMLAVSKEEIALTDVIEFTMEPGVIVMSKEIFEVTISTVDYETYIESSSWRALSKREITDYLEKLKILEGAEHWKFTVQ